MTEGTFEKQLRWRQEPGEIQDCHVFKLENSRHIEVNRLQVKFPEGSHHVHLYRSDTPEPDRVFDCFNGIDWTKWSLVVGAQTKAMDWQMPDGVTLPFEPHQQLLAQVHWLNSTPEPIEPEIGLAFHTTEESEMHLGTIFGVNQRVEVPAGQRVRVDHFCEVPEGAQLHALMGHFHQHGRDYKVWERMPGDAPGTGKQIYEAADEPTFEFKMWNPAHEVRAGAGFEYSCGFFNWSGQTLTWGSDTKTQEHCNMTAYYAPAEHVSTMCVLKPSKLTALTPEAETVRAGTDLVLSVELAEAEATDVNVALRSSDTTILEVPAFVTIKAGDRHATFYARTHRPAPVDISASLTGATVTTRVNVTGLVISEVFYQAAGGTTNDVQWIEIANRSTVAVDLSKYSLGAGTTDFTRTRAALPMSIPAGGCIVIGGPNSNSLNGEPFFDLLTDFFPDLGTGVSVADGIGLFSATMASIDSTSRPIDAVVYGAPITSLRGPDGQIAPVWPGALPGGSLRRVAETVWARTSNPTPGICEVLDAH